MTLPWSVKARRLRKCPSLPSFAFWRQMPSRVCRGNDLRVLLSKFYLVSGLERPLRKNCKFGYYLRRYYWTLSLLAIQALFRACTCRWISAQLALGEAVRHNLPRGLFPDHHKCVQRVVSCDCATNRASSAPISRKTRLISHWPLFWRSRLNGCPLAIVLRVPKMTNIFKNTILDEQQRERRWKPHCFDEFKR